MYLMLVWGGTNLFYAWHAFFSGKVPKEKRALWVALLLAANYFVMPFYFRWYIWPQEALSRSDTLHEAV
jgi:hypothetical protein